MHREVVRNLFQSQTFGKVFGKRSGEKFLKKVVETLAGEAKLVSFPSGASLPLQRQNSNTHTVAEHQTGTDPKYHQDLKMM